MRLIPNPMIKINNKLEYFFGNIKLLG